MASSQQLKRKLLSIKTTEQLSGAMKTVSAAKYSHLIAMRKSHADYVALCRSLATGFHTAEMPCNPHAPVCYVILGSNRGLCGSYNSELLTFAEQQLRESPGALCVVCGKTAVSFFSAHALPIYRQFTLPDIPTYEDCRMLIEQVRDLYHEGTVSAVKLLFAAFVNPMKQQPCVQTLLPAAPTDCAEQTEYLPLPDSQTVAQALQTRLTDTVLYDAVLEAAIGAQAATLNAMRTASDNAAEAAALLESEMNKRRQSEVTAGVLETYEGDNQ